MARHFRAGGPNRLLFSNGPQILGVALPWATAASFLGHRAVSVSWDGGFLFSGVELETAVRNNLSLVHVVIRDDACGIVAFETPGVPVNYEHNIDLARDLLPPTLAWYPAQSPNPC